MSTATSLWAHSIDLDQMLVDRVHENQVYEALEYASHVLWSLTGRKYGPTRCTIEQYDTTQSLRFGSQVYPMFINGDPYNISGCSSCACSSCGVLHRTRLRGYPVHAIQDVWVNGRLLDRTEYVLLDYSVLGLLTDDACNAQCIVVKYTYGTGIPPGGRAAAIKLTENLLRAGMGEACDLPARVTSVSRQGVSFTLLDPQDFLDKGLTGIYEIDLLIRALNPAGALKRPRVFSPDIRRAEVRNNPAAPPCVTADGEWLPGIDPDSRMRVTTGAVMPTPDNPRPFPDTDHAHVGDVHVVQQLGRPLGSWIFGFNQEAGQHEWIQMSGPLGPFM